MTTDPAPYLTTVATVLQAAAFAAERHRKQRRKGADADPYINHPLGVAALLASVAHMMAPDVLIAALLHDTVEDTETTTEELERLFGSRVRDLVAELTDDKALPKAERKRRQAEHVPGFSAEAKLIKLADLASNVAELIQRPPKAWSLDRKREYLEWQERVAAGCRGANPALERHLAKTVEEAREALGAK